MQGWWWRCRGGDGGREVEMEVQRWRWRCIGGDGGGEMEMEVERWWWRCRGGDGGGEMEMEVERLRWRGGGGGMAPGAIWWSDTPPKILGGRCRSGQWIPWSALLCRLGVGKPFDLMI